jgi:hypothetical protein
MTKVLLFLEQGIGAGSLEAGDGATMCYGSGSTIMIRLLEAPAPIHFLNIFTTQLTHG